MQAIDVTAIVRKLEDFVLGDAETMTGAQLEAAIGLLDKALPDLVEIKLSVREERAVRSSLEMR